MLKKFYRTNFIFLVFVSFFSSHLYGQKSSIKLEGDVTEDGSPLVAASIAVMSGGKAYTTLLSDSKGDYKFDLPQGKDYMILVSKQGYVSKRFAISTKDIPKELESNEFSTLTARVVLFKKLEGVDYTSLEKPMVKHFFNPTKQDFDYDIGYLNQMLSELENIKQAEKVVKDKLHAKDENYNTAIKLGDKAHERKEWGEALNRYKEALLIKPNEVHPQARITEINKIMADKAALDKANAERLAQDKAAADAARLAKEKADAELAKSKAEADRLAKEKADQEAKAKAEAARLEKEKADAEFNKAKAEADRIAKEKADADAKIKAENDRIAKEKADLEAKNKAIADAARLEKERLEKEAKDKIEAERLAKEKAALDLANAKDKQEKEAKAKLEADRLAKEKAELEQATARQKAAEARAKAEEDKLIKEFLEKEAKAKAEEERIAKAKAAEEALKAKIEETRVARELADAAKKAKEKAAQDSIKAKIEADRIAKAKTEADRLAKEKADAEAAKSKAEADRIAKEKADADAKLKAEQDRKAKELAAIEAAKAEKIAKDKADTEAKAKAIAEQDALNKTNLAKYQAEIKKADALFNERKYKEAELNYQNALTFKSGDIYAKDRLIECERIISSDANQKTDERQKQLLAKYPEGVTEEIVSSEGVLVIKRILVKSRVAYVYEKKVFNWGGIACFRDGISISEVVFEHDTKK